MSIRDELLALKRDDGLILASAAEEWARTHPESALHKSLQWDDAIAGHEYRLMQVRRLISIHIVSEAGERQVVSLSIDRTKPAGGYRDLDDVLPQPDLRDVLLQDALAELERVQAKYSRLQELNEVWAAKDRVKQGRRRQSKAEPGKVQLGAA